MIKLAFLLLVLFVASAVGQLCDGGEFYDHYPPEETTVQSVYIGQSVNGCANPNRHSYALKVVQLFTPPSVPYEYDSVCFALRLPSTTGISTTTPPKYTVISAEAGTDYMPSATTTAHTAVTSITMLTAGLLNFTVTLSTPISVFRPKIYIGIQLNLCYSSGNAPNTLYKLIATSSNIPRRLFYRANSAGTWVQETSANAVTIRATGTAISTVPAAFLTYCSANEYKDGYSCDCECGEYDPDCGGDYTTTTSCSSGICNSVGTCDTVDWTAAVAKHYDTRDGCDCYASTADLDCNDPYQPLLCNGLPRSTTTTTCTAGTCTSDNTWICNAALYRDGVLCDCDCGAIDPDCMNINTLTSCTNDELCSNTGTCLFPRSWKCAESQYNSGDQCDCEYCGAYDLDCDNTALASSCLSPFVCNTSNICAAIPETFVSSSSSTIPDTQPVVTSSSSTIPDTQPVVTSSSSTTIPDTQPIGSSSSSNSQMQPDPQPGSSNIASGSSSNTQPGPGSATSSLSSLSNNNQAAMVSSSMSSTTQQTTPSSSNGNNNVGWPVWMIAVVAGGGGLLLIAAIVIAAVLLSRGNKKKKEKDNDASSETATKPQKQTELAPLPVSAPTYMQPTPTPVTPAPAETAAPTTAAEEKPVEAKKEERVPFTPPTNDTTSVIHDSAGNTMFVLGKDAAGGFTYSDASGMPLKVEPTPDGQMVVVYTR